MECPVFHEETTADRDSVFVMVGPDVVHELARPTAPDSDLGRDLAAHGAMPYSFHFAVTDLDAVERHAASIGVGVASRTGDTVDLDRADMFNGVVGFTTRALPGDPRGPV